MFTDSYLFIIECPEKKPYLIVNVSLFALNLACLLSAIKFWLRNRRKKTWKMNTNCVCHTLSFSYDSQKSHTNESFSVFRSTKCSNNEIDWMKRLTTDRPSDVISHLSMCTAVVSRHNNNCSNPIDDNRMKCERKNCWCFFFLLFRCCCSSKFK